MLGPSLYLWYIHKGDEKEEYGLPLTRESYHLLEGNFKEGIRKVAFEPVG